MTRNLTSAQLDAVKAPQVLAVVFVEIEFEQPVRVCNAVHSVEWSGKTWLGLGNLGSIEQLQENANLEAKGVALTLSAVPLDMVSTALGEQYQGRKVQIWYAPCGPGGTPVGNPIRVFFGRVDTMDMEIGETATITLTAESRLVDWARPRSDRFNHESQLVKYPADMGLQYVPQMVDKEIRWGVE